MRTCTNVSTYPILRICYVRVGRSTDALKFKLRLRLGQDSDLQPVRYGSSTLLQVQVCLML